MSWQKNNSGIAAHNFVKNLNVANDGSEHAFNLLTTFNTGKVTQRKKEQEYLRRIASMLW